MIRHVALLQLKPGTSPAQVQALAAALSTLRTPGLISLRSGPDLGLREGNLGFAVVTDFEDQAAYHAYEADPEHNRIRAEHVFPITERAERCQFEVPG